MRVLITGGGTGGHTSPAVAVIQELRRRVPNVELMWAGCRGAVEERVSAMQQVPFRSVPSEGWPRRNSLRRVWVALKLMAGVVRALGIMVFFRPTMVVGVGGYVSLPVGLAAQLLRVPTFLHEQNKRLGMTNRILARRASRLFLSYENTLGTYPKEKAVVVGNPVRADFLTPPDRSEACRRFDLDPDRPVVLVSGGSQGARTLNQAMKTVVEGLGSGDPQFIWMTGKYEAEEARDVASGRTAQVRVFPFIEDMAGACAAADLIVSRAGASSTAELAVLGKPSILVPFPFATDNHQEKNARAFEESGASIVLTDAECTGERLTGLFKELFSRPERLAAMGHAAGALGKPDAAVQLVEVILKAI
ncbi:MAG TPA: undecaprenyldiphospho-muramoylpentapeptide beta-N-acetylglucosaminyltransferase [Candidatus Hydrogenedentes bacterium]|nr:undecaprenyldiphospho-muramoylpentapeptide beta-N-acetylglucosaminyltransferase [Candidatus Hydrogenedentota bacterium]